MRCGLITLTIFEFINLISCCFVGFTGFALLNGSSRNQTVGGILAAYFFINIFPTIFILKHFLQYLCQSNSSEFDSSEHRKNILNGFNAMLARNILNTICWIALIAMMGGYNRDGINGYSNVGGSVVSLLLIFWWRNSCNQWIQAKKK